VRRAAASALWALWFRSEGLGPTKELRRLLRQRDPAKALAGFERLLERAPSFAEAYNQRAILFFRLRQYDRSIADCEKALQLNPFHFGAQAGIGQCWLQLRRPRFALRAFRLALKIHPYLEDVAETVRSLEQSIEGDGRHDDKK
jgi:tetratricopeptide (TPR) repeat protein